MDWNILLSVAVLVFALTGFYFLARTLLSIWRQKGWMKGSQYSSGSSWDWENDECYRKCMDGLAPGTKNQYRHCADVCGLR